ncbi:hypothetical protein HPP92_027085 [Vanilla planifolia]|uniref:Uncharacterized protein n=1 Tax=Vanilla planifolia TaxID=51239 RepID=A0A835U589_VANPL|nr:hypothetical protein HPP92_027085 [Vanilla planifolia]
MLVMAIAIGKCGTRDVLEDAIVFSHGAGLASGFPLKAQHRMPFCADPIWCGGKESLAFNNVHALLKFTFIVLALLMV